MRRIKVPQLWQKWEIMRAQTGAFDKISFHGITETGSFETLTPKISLFSSGLRFGSSFGELWAWKKQISALRDE